ncbi:MAG: Gldg family protein [Pseudohongiella sp.]|nr:Gldg family protein [Pseudohongiella sp.]
MNKKALFSNAGLALTALGLLITVVIISLLPRIRIDLTEDSLYTLSDATRDIVANLERPVEMTFFYSEESVAEVPQVRAYGLRVQEMLREMVIASNGNLSFEIVDPAPFSEDEDRATAYGIQAVPLAAGREAVYFGVVATDPATQTEEDAGVYQAIPLVRPDQEEFLEYEFARLITRTLDPDPTVIGLLTSLEIDGGFNASLQQATRAWAVMDTVRYMYDVQRIASTATSIDSAIDILLIVHPQELPAQTLYAIDQFVMRGGRALIFVDPNSDTQTQIAVNTGDFRDSMSSDLPGLLQAWGVQYDATQVVTDQERALYVTLQPGQRPVAHLGMMGVQRDGFANDIVSGQLQVMNMSSAGALSKAEGSLTTFEPLIQTSNNTMMMGTAFFSEMGDPTLLLDEFVSEEQTRFLAARVSGRSVSAFPDGPPVADDDANPAETTSADTHLSESIGDIGVIVIADSDVLADRMWAQSQQVLGQRVINAFASNGDFVINALDNLSGSTALINIRSRGRYARPFTRVIDLQRAADERLRAEETNLLQRLSETEQQLTALNQNNGGTISPEQNAEIERFIQVQTDTRRALRDVQFQLNAEIDRLGTTLKFINTALIPGLLVIAALALAWIRSRRRKLAVRQ